MLQQLDISSSLTSKVKTSLPDFVMHQKNPSTPFISRKVMRARLSSGHHRSFELGTFLASNDDQNNSSDQRQAA
jgi:hypothetical protein